MTLKQLISRYSWLNVEATLLNEYPDKLESISEYESVFQTLLLLPGSKTDLQICIERRQDEDSTEMSIEVTGSKQTPHITHAQLSIPYALNFTPWAEWLSMPVAPKTFQLFSETEIITYCLLEMTSNGFDEATIQMQAQHLSNDMELVNGDNEGFAISWEQIINLLNSKEQ